MSLQESAKGRIRPLFWGSEDGRNFSGQWRNPLLVNQAVTLTVPHPAAGRETMLDTEGMFLDQGFSILSSVGDLSKLPHGRVCRSGSPEATT